MKRILFLVALLSAPAYADEPGVYETLAGVSIGRVFLTPEERRLLDLARREGPTNTTDSGGQPVDGPAEPTLRSAGYIQSSNGKSRQWRDGEFVESRGAPSRDMRFPGDVKIVRHPAKPEPIEPASTDGSSDE